MLYHAVPLHDSDMGSNGDWLTKIYDPWKVNTHPIQTNWIHSQPTPIGLVSPTPQQQPPLAYLQHTRIEHTRIHRRNIAYRVVHMQRNTTTIT